MLTLQVDTSPLGKRDKLKEMTVKVILLVNRLVPRGEHKKATQYFNNYLAWVYSYLCKYGQNRDKLIEILTNILYDGDCLFNKGILTILPLDPEARNSYDNLYKYIYRNVMEEK